jgi:hypothetical protein
MKINAASGPGRRFNLERREGRGHMRECFIYFQVLIVDAPLCHAIAIVMPRDTRPPYENRSKNG